MRVGYIVPSLDDTTGWGRWANDFLRHIAARGIEPVIYAPPSSARHWNSHDGSARFSLPEFFDYLQSSTGLQRLRSLAACRQTMARSSSVDLVHSFDAHPWGIYGDWLARRHRVPHVITTHGRYGYIAQHRWTDRAAYRGVLRRAAQLIAVSEAVKHAVLAGFAADIPASRITVLQNPVDDQQFQQAGTLPPDVPPTGPVLISVTRFIPVKDIETAVRAFAAVKAAHPDASYWIIGPGNGPNNPYYLEIRGLIDSLGVSGIHIVGRVSKDVLSAFYRRATLLVHTARTLPDDFEASGLILLEAGLMGLPVVASASGGIPEVVAAGETGLLVPEQDHVTLSHAVNTLLDDASACTRLGDANRARALTRNWRRYAGRQLDIYGPLIAKRIAVINQ